MFKKFLEKKYLKKIKSFTADKLLDEYFELRSKGNMLYSMNVFQHDDIEHWKICEDYLINTKIFHSAGSQGVQPCKSSQ